MFPSDCKLPKTEIRRGQQKGIGDQIMILSAGVVDAVNSAMVALYNHSGRRRNDSVSG